MRVAKQPREEMFRDFGCCSCRRAALLSETTLPCFVGKAPHTSVSHCPTRIASSFRSRVNSRVTSFPNCSLAPKERWEMTSMSSGRVKPVSLSTRRKVTRPEAFCGWGHSHTADSNRKEFIQIYSFLHMFVLHLGAALISFGSPTEWLHRRLRPASRL